MLTDLLAWWRQFPTLNPTYVKGLEKRQKTAEEQAKYGVAATEEVAS